MRLKKFLAVPALALVLVLNGCSAYTVATRASAVIGAVLAVAAAEQQVVPVQDQAIYSGFVTLGQSLHTQLDSCIAAAAKPMVTKKGTFLACFNGFASGLSSPAELAQLRLLSPGLQSKVQLYLVGIITGVNVAVSAFGGTTAIAPVVGPAPTAADLDHLRIQVGY